MATPIRLGICGTGFFGRTRAQTLAQMTDARLALGWSHSDASRVRWTAETALPAVESWEELCVSPEVDAVLVCTPHNEHAVQAKAALEAGKHVLVETPLALRHADALELSKLAAARGLVLHHGAKWRYHPDHARYIDRLRQVLPLLVGGDQWTWDYGRERSWYTQRELTGGARSFLSYTLVDWLEAYGEVSRVVGSECRAEEWESASLLLSFAAGGCITVGYAVGQGMPSMNDRYVIGKGGSIRTTAQGLVWEACGESGAVGRDAGDVVRAECQAFLDEIRGRRDASAHLARDLRAMELVEQALGEV